MVEVVANHESEEEESSSSFSEEDKEAEEVRIKADYLIKLIKNSRNRQTAKQNVFNFRLRMTTFDIYSEKNLRNFKRDPSVSCSHTSNYFDLDVVSYYMYRFIFYNSIMEKKQLKTFIEELKMNRVTAKRQWTFIQEQIRINVVSDIQTNFKKKALDLGLVNNNPSKQTRNFRSRDKDENPYTRVFSSFKSALEKGGTIKFNFELLIVDAYNYLNKCLLTDIKKHLN